MIIFPASCRAADVHKTWTEHPGPPEDVRHTTHPDTVPVTAKEGTQSIYYISVSGCLVYSPLPFPSFVSDVLLSHT